MSRHLPKTGSFAAAAAIAVAAAVAAALISWKTLGLVSHVSDEIAYTFQARILASGHLRLAEPAVPAALEVQHVIAKDGIWVSMYPPGWPLLLVPGIWLGAPWIVSPLLLLLSVLGVFTLGRELHDERTGLAASALLAVSPFVLLHGAGRMSHLPTLCLAVWCAVFLERAASGATERRGRALIAAGALGGAAWLVRQISATALLLPLVMACLWRLRKDRAGAGGLARLALGAAPAVAVYLAFNAAVFGGPFISGYRVHDPTLRFNGYGGDYAAYPSLFVANAPEYLLALSRCAWGFPWPDLLLLAPLLRPARGREKDALLGAGVMLLVLVFSLYWFYDIVYGGPRLVFEAMGFLAILAARGVLEAASWAGPLAWRVSPSVRGAVAGAAAAALLTWPAAARLPGLLRYHALAYQGAAAGTPAGASAAGVGPDAIVFVSGRSFAYGTFFEANSVPAASSRRIFVRDIAEIHEPALVAWPRPEVWQVEIRMEPVPGPNVYEDAFVVAGVEWHRVH